MSFQKVLDLEHTEKGEWGFKALKQMIKINFKLVSDEIFTRNSYSDLAKSVLEQLQRDDESIQATFDVH